MTENRLKHGFSDLMRFAMPILALVALLAAGLACARSSDLRSGVQMSSHELEHDGLVRSYHLVVPETTQPGKPIPLVLWLHGGGGRGDRMCRIRGGIQELAAEEGFIVACPDGIENHWNDGRDIEKWRSHADEIDDTGFLLALVDQLKTEYPIDPGRVYVSGVSNGGKMSFRLACEATDVFAAAAPLIGSMPQDLNCDPSQPISILVMNGTDDPLVPWEGGQVRFGRTELGQTLSTPNTIAFWVTADGCAPEPEHELLPDLDPEDGTRLSLDTYSNCSAGARVLLYAVEGGGHTWPGGPQYAPEFLIGRVSKDLNAGEVIWDFFKSTGS